MITLRKIEEKDDKVFFTLMTERGTEYSFTLRVDSNGRGPNYLEDVSGEFTRFIWLNHYGDAMRPILQALGRVGSSDLVLPLEIPCGDV